MSDIPPTAPTSTAAQRASWLPLDRGGADPDPGLVRGERVDRLHGRASPADLDTPATSVGTAITAGTFSMAAFILLGAKIGARFGTRKVFQIAVASTPPPWPAWR